MGMQLLTYRGHIRNWKTLCEELKVDKNLPRHEREQALLLRGFAAWGMDVASHLYGMFAFALQVENRIIAFRDQFGAKPFYYYVTEQKELLCGTFIRNILDRPGFHRELDEDALQNYLTLAYAGGENTFFKGLRKLMPGHYLIFEEGKPETHAYWTPVFRPDASRSAEEYAEDIHRTMQEIMEELQDDEAEAFLSSGVDSSYVLAMSRAKLANSCGYEEASFDESGLAEETAKKLGRQINRCLITPEEYFAEVPSFCQHAELPLADASAVVYAIACRHAAVHTKVCYSGEGADEFFGGYRMYGNAQRYAPHLHEFYVGNTMIMKEAEKQELLRHYNGQLLPVHMVQETYAQMKDADPLAKMMRIDMELWLEGDIYLNVDKMSEAYGLEVQMPVTDVRMFEVASRIPPEYKVTDAENKVAFRMAAEKVLPAEVAHRRKLGFIVPIRYWLADPRYNRDVKAKLSGKSAEKFFHMDKLQQIFEAYISGDSDLWRKIWTIYIFLVWYDIYFAQEDADIREGSMGKITPDEQGNKTEPHI